MARDAEKFVNIEDSNLKIKQNMNLKRTKETIAKVKDKKKKRTKATMGQALVVEPLAPEKVTEQVCKPSEMSLVNMLSQGLTSNDKDMIEECLKVIDGEMIKATVLALNPEYLLPLIKGIKERLILKPNRIQQLKHWAIAVITLRTDRLKSIPECLEEIEELLQFCSLQTQMLPKLLITQQMLKLKEEENVDSKLCLTSVGTMLIYDEETGKNEIIDSSKPTESKFAVPLEEEDEKERGVEDSDE